MSATIFLPCFSQDSFCMFVYAFVSKVGVSHEKKKMVAQCAHRLLVKCGFCVVFRVHLRLLQCFVCCTVARLLWCWVVVQAVLGGTVRGPVLGAVLSGCSGCCLKWCAACG